MSIIKRGPLTIYMWFPGTHGTLRMVRDIRILSNINEETEAWRPHSWLRDHK